MDQAIQILGAVLILVPFAAVQFGRMGTGDAAYLALNLAGSAVLAASAVAHAQLGFVLLEAVWGAVALWGLVRRGRAGAPAG